MKIDVSRLQDFEDQTFRIELLEPEIHKVGKFSLKIVPPCAGLSTERAI